MARIGLLRTGLAALLLLSLGAGVAAPASAQGNDYFVPNQRPAGTTPARPPAGRPPPSTPQTRTQPTPPPLASTPAVEPEPVAQIPAPPVPQLPALPKTAPPPAAIYGVIGVPEVMRASTAAQQIDKVIGERRQKLNEDAQKEQGVWRDMQQSLANQRANLSPEQIRTRERELQERITNAQRQLQSRNRIIQEAAQAALGQIQSMLIAVIRQVSESRGMNMVLHRQAVALNINDFDITDAVAEQLNKLLPTVDIAPEGVSPVAAAPKPAATPAASTGPAPAPKQP
jgi:Skp family chaperone for outer membrane proteins